MKSIIKLRWVVYGFCGLAVVYFTLPLYLFDINCPKEFLLDDDILTAYTQDAKASELSALHDSLLKKSDINYLANQDALDLTKNIEKILSRYRQKSRYRGFSLSHSVSSEIPFGAFCRHSNWHTMYWWLAVEKI